MIEIQISFALAVGSELIREEDLSANHDLQSLAAKDGIFGALILDVDGEEIVDERYWDRLDLVLERLYESIDEAEDGNEGVAEFPETRIELIVRPSEDEDGEVEVEVEDTSVTVGSRELRSALIQCIERLTELLEDVGGKAASHVDRLRALVKQ